MAQSEKELHDQRAFLVWNFRNTLGLYSGWQERIDNGDVGNDDDPNDPFALLERQPPAIVLKKKYKEVKSLSKDTINKAILMVPKGSKLQQRYVQKRILSVDDSAKKLEKIGKEANLTPLSDKLKKKVNLSVSDEEFDENEVLRPRLFDGTGKLKFRVKRLLNQ